MTCWVMGPEWKDEDIILGVDFLIQEGMSQVKCKLVKAQLEYLGHIVSNGGVAPIPS